MAWVDLRHGTAARAMAPFCRVSRQKGIAMRQAVIMALVAAAMSLATGPAAAQVSTVFLPEQIGLRDADVYEFSYRNWNNADWGASGSVAIGSNVTGITATRRRIYYSFSQLMLPRAATPGSRIALQITGGGSPSEGTVKAQVYRVASPWQAGNGTYHSGQTEQSAAPGIIRWTNQPDIDVSRIWASQFIDSNRASYRFDITDLVKAWQNGDFPNYGLVIIGANEGHDRYQYVFEAADGTHASLRPRIIVTSAATGKRNLLLNGSFETANAGNGQISGIAHWQVLKANVDIVDGYWQQIDGAKSVDLAGTYGSGAIAQSFATTPGRQYVVSFFMAGNPSCDAPLKEMEVSAAGQVMRFSMDVQGHSRASMGWQRKSWGFVANAQETQLVFASVGPNQGCGATIDDITVVAN